MSDEPALPELEPFEIRAVDPEGPISPALRRRLDHAGVVPPLTMRSAIRDLVSQERVGRWVRGPGSVGVERRWEVPHDIDDALEERTPQNCLRNLYRHEMDAWPDDLWWQFSHVRTTLAEAAAEAAPARAAHLDPPALLEELSYAALPSLKRTHQDLTLRTDWSTFDWRRGPDVP